MPLVAHLDPGVVGAGVELGADGQAGAGGGGGDGVDDDLVAGQRPAAPVHGDVGDSGCSIRFHFTSPAGSGIP